MTTTYILEIAHLKAAYTLTYKKGVISRIQRNKGILKHDAWANLLLCVPQKESGLSLLKTNPMLKYVKQEKKTKGAKSLHTRMVEVYTRWYVTRHGIAYNFRAVDGAAIKSIKKVLIDFSSSENQAFDMWNVILSNWDKLDDFYRRQVECRQINSNINIILRTLKNEQRNTSSFRDRL